jgi:hypothetical protein
LLPYSHLLSRARKQAVERPGFTDPAGSGYTNLRNLVLRKVAPGFYADIIAVEGEPWKDINAIFKVKWVMKNGTIVSSP